MTLLELRTQLCSDQGHFCRKCFVGKASEPQQCPPNVFRAEGAEKTKPITFIFDKPNDNTRYKHSPLIPIAVFDDRAGIDIGLKRAPSHKNLLILCRLLGIIKEGSSDLHSDLVHITNAAKCDVSAESGDTGRIILPKQQIQTCCESFLAHELEIVKSKALVFFGRNAQRYVLNDLTTVWHPVVRTLAGREYIVMRVPHTSPQSFNTHGKHGLAYIEPFHQLRSSINEA